jgi:hypothetical protein
MSAEADPQGALVAAEAALGDGDIEAAEDATLEALSRIRQLKSTKAGDGS